MGLSPPLDYLYNYSTRNLALPTTSRTAYHEELGVRWLTSQPIPALVAHLPRTTRARHSLAMEHNIRIGCCQMVGQYVIS